MNRGLITKSVCEVWAVTLLCGAGLLAFQILFAYIINSFGKELTEQWVRMMQMRFFQSIMRSLLGSEIGDQFNPGAFGAIVWVHPVVLSLVWAHGITVCTRVPAGEVDRGTIDVLFGLPVSRWSVYLCESAVWLVAGITVVGMALVGCMLGRGLFGEGALSSPGQLIVVAVNLLFVYVVVGSVALLISSLSDRRGRAVAVAFGVVLASFLLNFLAQFWPPAQGAAFLSVLHYYKPLLILRDTGWPLHDLAALSGCGAALWLAGGLVFARRDICTV